MPDSDSSLFTFDAEGWRVAPVEAFDTFLAQRRFNGRRLRPSSFVIYRGMLQRLLEWLGERGLVLHDLDERLLDRFLSGRQLAPQSRHRYLLVFTELYRHLAILRNQEHNPAYELLTSQPAPERIDPEALTPEEARAVLDTLCEMRKPGWKSRRLVCMVCMLLGEGLRTTELLRLRVRDINERHDAIWVMPHKPRPQRSVPLTEPAKTVLLEWLSTREQLQLPRECQLLFPGKLNGQALSAATLFRQVQALLAAAGVERRYEGPMLLRNTRAAAWLAANPTYKVKDWLGHEHERTTEQLLPLALHWAGERLLDEPLKWPPLAGAQDQAPEEED